MPFGNRELFGALFQRRRDLAGDEGRVDPGELAEALDTHAVADMEALRDLAGTRVIDATVRQDPIAIAHQEPDPSRPPDDLGRERGAGIGRHGRACVFAALSRVVPGRL